VTTPTLLRTVEDLGTVLGSARAEGRSVGFVPTMGALHAGHRSLMQRAADENDCVVVSVFVNPLQFAAHEDLDRYPRELEQDLVVCGEEQVDIVFAPSVNEMYPSPILTTVSVSPLHRILDGASRPGHFDGVATVVAKLFSMVGPCRAYFGEKDWQQLAIISRMTTDLSLPVTVRGCPTVREPDGLALSSRNVYLTDEQRTQATVLRRALDAGLELLAAGMRDPEAVGVRMAEVVRTASDAELDYAVAVPADTLQADGDLSGVVRLLLAVRFGTTRLIDNDGVDLSNGS